MSSGINIFYHVTQLDGWDRLLQQQIHSMCVSGLIDECDGFYVGVNGNQSVASFVPKKSTVVFHKQTDWAEETPTIKQIRDFSNNNSRKKILYIHTKGITRNNTSHDAWRLYMEYFCVHRWRDCVRDLDDHDCTGCLWISENELPVFPPGSRPHTHYPAHFSGNFWWAKTDYIQKLDHNLLETVERTDREFWIGSANPKTKAYRKGLVPLHGGDFYSTTVLSEDYI
jgi:hypothetical protein